MTVTATLTSKGQVTIPKAIRDLLDLASQDLLIFTVRKPKEVVMTSIKTDLMSLRGALKVKKYIPFKTARRQAEKLAGKQIAAEGL